MLEIESLDGSGYEVITSNESLFELLVLFVLLSNLVIFKLVRIRRKVESKDCRSLLKQNTHIFLEIFDG